jgi:hypothetical protein
MRFEILTAVKIIYVGITTEKINVVDYSIDSEVLPSANIKMAVFWVVQPCRLVEIN